MERAQADDFGGPRAVEHGAATKLVTSAAKPDRRDGGDVTLFAYASMGGRKKVVEALIVAGADADAKEPPAGGTKIGAGAAASGPAASPGETFKDCAECPEIVDGAVAAVRSSMYPGTMLRLT